MGSFSRKLGNALAGAAEVATPAAFQVQRQNAMEARDKRLNAYNVANQKTQNEFISSEGDKTRKIQQAGVDSRGSYYEKMGERIDQAIEIGNLNKAEMERAVKFNARYKDATPEERALMIQEIPSALNDQMWEATTVKTGTEDPVTGLEKESVLLQRGGQFRQLNLADVPMLGGGAGGDTIVIKGHPKLGDVTEGDIQATMKDQGMSYKDVIARLESM